MLATVILLAAVLHRPPSLVAKVYASAPACPVLAVAVVERESEFNPRARHVNDDGSVDGGLYQTNSRWHPRFDDVDAHIKYGGENLQAVVARFPTLQEALGYYNTGSPRKGEKYARRVMRTYGMLLDWLGEGRRDAESIRVLGKVARSEMENNAGTDIRTGQFYVQAMWMESESRIGFCPRKRTMRRMV